MLDSVIRVYKKCFPQTLLEEFKYEMKKKQKTDDGFHPSSFDNNESNDEYDNESDNESGNESGKTSNF